MMKEQLITSETARLAKEKGFDEKHSNFYVDEKENGGFTAMPCVPQSLLQKWLREVHRIEVAVIPAYSSLNLPEIGYALQEDKFLGDNRLLMFLGIVNDQNSKETGIDDYYCYHDTWEEALEVILQEGLKLVKDG